MVAALACGAAIVPPEAVPEPTHALRPAKRSGSIVERARTTDYALDVTLDADAHTLSGKATVIWRNRTEASTDELVFHLYMNAFRAEDTEWMRRSGGVMRGQKQSSDQPWGYCDVHSVRLSQGDASIPSRTTDDDAPAQPTTSSGAVSLEYTEGDDPTLMTVRLPHAIDPGQSVAVDLEFTTLLPRVFARTGFAEQFVMAAQWYPKLAVFDASGTWQAHVFTPHSEFFADFGAYEVQIDVPEPMVVGASGILVSEQTFAQRRRLVWRAEMVHDFAWTAAPDFYEDVFAYDDVRVRQLVAPEYHFSVPIHREALLGAARAMEERFGPYPWSTITIVQPPPGASGAEGMEYPTLFTTAAPADVPRWLRWAYDDRMTGAWVTLHEFGHQYFQGLVASDEHAEPWLDEGINTTANLLVAQDWTGSADPWTHRILGKRYYLSDMIRRSLGGLDVVEAIDRPADAFWPVLENYGPIVYRRTAALMMTLRALVGADPFDRAMRTYVDRYRFAHPTGDDFVAVLLETIGSEVVVSPAADDTESVTFDVARFLEQGLQTAWTIDFEVVRTYNSPQPQAGWHRTAAGELAVSEASDDRPVDATVVLHRAGTLEVPALVEVEFADGSVRRRWWSADQPTAIWRWPGERVVGATIDPQGIAWVESRRTNNHRFATDADPEGLQLPQTSGDLAEIIAWVVALGVGP